MTVTALIAIDWGTTSARAYCLDATGQVVARRLEQNLADAGVRRFGGRHRQRIEVRA